MNPPAKKRVAKEAPPPILIVKKLRHKAHPHGAWKVAYADFVTTMMALFIVLWAASQSPNVRQSIASYFRNASVTPTGGTGAGVLPSASGVIARAEADSPRAESESDTRNLEEAAAGIRAEMEKNPDLRDLIGQVRIEMTPEGLRIQIVEQDEHLLFEIGSAQIKPALTRLLTIVAAVVGKLPNQVTVEGHTDSRPYSYRKGYSNWELSADRANAARRVLEASGLRTGQVTRVIGYADHDLLVTDALDAQNRRVSIIVKRQGATPNGQPPNPIRASEGLQRLNKASEERG